ncbi:seven-hairpin glycosidase [Mycena filopes]|nr:seven-hairpin glycosidase [Mycena filopes]
MPRLSCIVLLLGLSSSSWAGVTVQVPGLTVPAEYASRRTDAQTLFTTSYAAYKQFAFGHDDLSPVSKGFSDGRNGWGASIVDAMPTMDLFQEAVNFSANIDFSTSKTGSTVSLFETTIRYVGGLLSSYELSGEQFPILVTKAQQVADKMAFAWTGSNIAEAGTLSLEWATLSKYTGNATYGNLTARSVKHIVGLPAPLPGLSAQGIDPTSGNAVGSYVTWGGGSDSHFVWQQGLDSSGFDGMWCTNLCSKCLSFG